MMLSRHLSLAELACKDPQRTPYPTAFILDGRLSVLAMVFEGIRAACGHRPIRVLSAYRTVDWNRRIGGARNSQHVQGRALDLQPPAGYTVSRFYDVIVDLAETSLPEIRGIGKYQTFVHVDTRPGAVLVRWSSSLRKDA